MTAIHRRVAACRAGTDPTQVARLTSGWVVMGDPQVFVGYCLLLPDPVVSHLNTLAPGEQARRYDRAVDGPLQQVLRARLGDAGSGHRRFGCGNARP